jgi:hypothetical protein
MPTIVALPARKMPRRAGLPAEERRGSMRSYIFGLSLAAVVATVACSSSSANPSGGGGGTDAGGGADAGGESGHSCYTLVDEDGGVAGCGMLTYSAGVSGGCGGATPNSGSCPSANLAGCCVGAAQMVGGTSDTVQDSTCYYGGPSIAAMGKMLCTDTWQTTVP